MFNVNLLIITYTRTGINKLHKQSTKIYFIHYRLNSIGQTIDILTFQTKRLRQSRPLTSVLSCQISQWGALLVDSQWQCLVFVFHVLRSLWGRWKRKIKTKMKKRINKIWVSILYESLQLSRFQIQVNYKVDFP